MDTLMVLLGLGLPWGFGAALLHRRLRSGGWPLVLGYGYFIGIIAITLWLRVANAIGLPLSFPIAAGGLAAATAATLWLGRRASDRSEPQKAGTPNLWATALMALMGLSLGVRYFGLALEIAWEPLYAWDTWATWAPKSRVWYELGTLVPFVDWATWLERGGETYTIAGYYYPPTLPLTQVWMCLALGRWDESLMNFPTLGCAIALGLAVYGQARAWGIAPLPALATVYVLLSLPLINSHVALAGNADLWLGAVYGLAAMAFLQWCRTGESLQGWLALGFGVACSQIKTPGIVWMLSFFPALVVFRVKLSRRLIAASAAVAVLSLAGVAAALPHVEGLELAFHPETVEAVVTSFFSLATWHLFWYVWVVVFAAAMARVWRERLFQTSAVLVGTGFVFLAGVYGFTSFAEFALDFTQLNRATLHMVPMLAFVALTAAHDAVKGDTRSRRSTPV